MELANVFLMGSSGWALTLGLLFLVLLYWYLINTFTVLKKCGIKHPKPVPFFGNSFMFSKGFYDPLNDLIKTYGRVCGYYLGQNASVVIADPDMLKEVLVKSFTFFPNRDYIPFAKKPMSDCLLLLRNEDWKRVRSILTPSFSVSKLKEMVPFITVAKDALMRNLTVLAQSAEGFDIYKCFTCFTMDVIASVAFATKVDSLNNPDNPFVHHTQAFFSMTFFRPLNLLCMVFPFLSPLLKFTTNKDQHEMNQFFIRTIREVIKQREQEPPEQQPRDFLQLMLEARSSMNEECVSAQTSASHSDNQPLETSTKHPQKKTMSDDEIVAQAFVFILAGTETSASTMTFACYLLALHPECQRKVIEEVDQFFSRHDSLDYLNVQELKYMEMVINETLRLFTPAFRFAREVDRDCVVNGQRLPKGATLVIPAAFLHRDPEYWPEPDKFLPERFAPEGNAVRHPFAYLPFGAGPRFCVGTKLAYMEIKIVLASLFRKFSVETCAKTKIPPELKSTVTLCPKKGIFLKLKKRHIDEVSTQ